MSPSLLAGADGCKAGWVVAFAPAGRGAARCRILPSVPALFERHPELAVLAIDIPIGLPERGARECDRSARRLLGRPRGSSVFPAPIRPVLQAKSYTEACRIGRAVDGRGLSRQCWHLLPKIRELDDFLRSDAGIGTRVHEVHPEVSLALMSGAPMASSKRRPGGRRERLAALRATKTTRSQPSPRCSPGPRTG